LLFPDRLELPPPARDALARHDALLSSLGFEWSELGEGCYVVRAIPSLAARSPATQLFQDTLLSLVRPAEDRMGAALRAIARRAAVRNGEPLDDSAARDIVASVWPSQDAHRSCVIATVPMPHAEIRTSHD